MKKVLLIGLALATSIGLVACGNKDNSAKKSNKNVQTEHSKSNTKKTKKNDEKKQDMSSVKDNKNSNEEKDANTKQDATNDTVNSSADSTSQNTQGNEPTRSQKDETNGRGNVVTNSTQAIDTLSNGLGNNSDFYYTVISTANHMYEIQVTSKSIRAQGGTGTVGIYDVMEDGTYFLRP